MTYVGDRVKHNSSEWEGIVFGRNPNGSWNVDWEWTDGLDLTTIPYVAAFSHEITKIS